MRLLFVQPTGDRRGHFPEYTAKLCRALAQQGHDVVLMTNRIDAEAYIGSPVPFEIRLAHQGKLRFDHLVTAGRKFSFEYTRAYLLTCFKVIQEAFSTATSEPFDIIHVTGAEFSLLALCTMFYGERIPPVVTDVSAVNFSFTTYPGPWPIRIYKEIQRRLLRCALRSSIAGITVLGEFHHEGLQRQLQLPSRVKVEVLHDGGEEPSSPLDRLVARQKLGLPEDGDLLLFFGLIRVDKGVPSLLDAMARMKSRKVRLLIAGYPSDISANDIHEQIRRLGLENRVITRLEYIPDEQVQNYFYACDALILPYTKRYTGGSGPFLRGACAHGRPAIVSNVSEMGLLVNKYRVGMVAAPESPEDLAEKIDQFLSLSQSEREELASRGLDLARANSWTVMAGKLTGMYEAITGRQA